MLIRSLRADGFLKFRKIRLDNIPRRGLIGLVGPNESGKSSLGQLIQYALFGTTHKMTRGSIVDLIHWEEDHCIVELDLEHDGECYRIWREMDRLGSSYARLLRLDETDNSTGEEVAAGVIQVQKEVSKRFQLSATETLHSFYLAERESVTTPEHFRSFLDRVAGIDVLQGANRKVDSALRDLEEVFTANQTEIQRNELHISRLQPNIEKIPDLESELDSREMRLEALHEDSRVSHSRVQRTESQRDEVNKIYNELKSLDGLPSGEAQKKCNGLMGLLQADLAPEPIKNAGEISSELCVSLEKLSAAHDGRLALDRVLEEAQQSLEQKLSDDHEASFVREIERHESDIAQLSGSQLRHRALALVTFLAGLIFIFVGLNHELEWGFSEYIPQFVDFNQEKGTGFLLSAFGAALFVFSSWLWSKASLDKQKAFDAEGHVARLEMERDVAGASLESTHAHIAHGKAGLDPGEDVSHCRLRGVQESLESLRSQRREIQSQLGEEPGSQLASRLQPVVESVRKTLRSNRKKLDEANEAIKRLKSKRDRLSSQIREYQNQEGRRKTLEEVNDGLRSKSFVVREEMDVHRLLSELLEETIESVRLRTGPSLGKGLCRLLPHLTGGRYRDAQVTRDFEIKLFTGAKSDFLQTHELSGGTLQGLTFGFRLAFAQAYVKAVTGAPQFLFLDEPFPAMDRDRVLHTLRALPRLSRELSQVFVAHPDLEAEARSCFDHVIDTELGKGELVFDFAHGGDATSIQGFGSSTENRARKQRKAGKKRGQSAESPSRKPTSSKSPKVIQEIDTDSESTSERSHRPTVPEAASLRNRPGATRSAKSSPSTAQREEKDRGVMKGRRSSAETEKTKDRQLSEKKRSNLRPKKDRPEKSLAENGPQDSEKQSRSDSPEKVDQGRPFSREKRDRPESKPKSGGFNPDDWVIP